MYPEFRKLDESQIDYGKIAASIAHYKDRGYRYMEVPWLVSEESLKATAPAFARLFMTSEGGLLASGEQAFIEIRKWLSTATETIKCSGAYIAGQIKAGKFACATPCFRDEAVKDRYHLPQFFKVELIHVAPVDVNGAFADMIFDARLFFENYAKTKLVQTDIGTDIFIGDVEVGSYGYRTFDKFGWVYGTGCAEPRLSQATGK